MTKRNQYYNFNRDYASNESEIARKMCEEIVAIYGIDVYYISRTQENLDKFFGEDSSTKFEDGYEMVVICDGIENFSEGETTFSKFGFVSNYSLTIYVEKEAFKEQVSDTLETPRVGDLIYIPIMDKFFEISFFNDRPIFYHLGQTYAFEMSLTQFRYTHEEISTGFDDIDDNIPTDTISNDPDNDVIDDAVIFESTITDELNSDDE